FWVMLRKLPRQAHAFAAGLEMAVRRRDLDCRRRFSGPRREEPDEAILWSVFCGGVGAGRYHGWSRPGGAADRVSLSGRRTAAVGWLRGAIRWAITWASRWGGGQIDASMRGIAATRQPRRCRESRTAGSRRAALKHSSLSPAWAW